MFSLLAVPLTSLALLLAAPGVAAADSPASPPPTSPAVNAPAVDAPAVDPGAEEVELLEAAPPMEDPGVVDAPLEPFEREAALPQPAEAAPPAAAPAPGSRTPRRPAVAPAEEPALPLVTTATVPGRVAMMRRDGRAAIPRGAPKAIRAIIAAANEIVGKPYKWGGGHAKLIDRGYDCSGTVSYALIRAGLLAGVRVSGGFARWAAPGAGRWLTVHANAGHVYLEVAGLRLDTSAVGDRSGRRGVRWRPVIGGRPRFTARHILGL